VHDIGALLGPTRTVSERALAAEVSDRSVRRWVTTGRLVRLHPGWVTLPEWAHDWTVRASAATGYTGGTLSHLSALWLHGALDRPESDLHVTVPLHHRLRSTRELRIHRSSRRCALVIRNGLAATTLARSLVDSWGEAHRGTTRGRSRDLARNAVLRSCRERRIDVASVEAELAAVPHLPGLDLLRDLLADARAGSESQLEILGVRALTAAGLPRPELQYRIALPHGSVRVDAAWPQVRLAVEFDGAAFHAGRDDWQRDLRRDAALAAAGWVVLRFSWADVTQRPELCGAQVLAAYRDRRNAVPGADRVPARTSASGTTWP
jgi:very-short-patch-repair endonuclease